MAKKTVTKTEGLTLVDLAETEVKKNYFNFNEQLEHYTGVANGTIPTKKSDKYSSEEQKAYARGQRDAMNKQRRIFKRKNSSPEAVKEYDKKRAKKQLAFWEKEHSETKSEHSAKKVKNWSNRLNDLSDD